MLTIFNTLIMLFKIHQNLQYLQHLQSDKVKLHFS
jgi:hypothetical protein